MNEVMSYTPKKNKKYSMMTLKTLTLLALPLMLSACGDDNEEIIIFTAPETYDFTSRTNPGMPSSVDYKDATTRLVIIKELEYLIGSDYLQDLGAQWTSEFGQAYALPKVYELLNAIYETGTKSGTYSLVNQNIYDLYDPDNLEISGSTPIKGLNFLTPPDFSSLSENINLRDAMPGVTLDLHNRKENEEHGDFIGWGISGVLDGDDIADQLIKSWFQKIASLATDGDKTTRFTLGNLNLQALISSFLSVSIPYFQVSNIHLNSDIGLLSDNNESNTDFAYTQLEHHWDLAFGYYGTLITANTESLETIIATPSRTLTDLNALLTNTVFDFAVSMAQRDYDATFHDVHFSKNINKSFLEGREVIRLNNPDVTDIQKKVLLHDSASDTIIIWERAIAANLVHHINRTIDNGHSLDETYEKHWAKMKVYALALQFSPYSSIDNETLKKINEAIRQIPHARTSSINNYLADILEVRDSIQAIYNFSDENVQRW